MITDLRMASDGMIMNERNEIEKQLYIYLLLGRNAIKVAVDCSEEDEVGQCTGPKKNSIVE